MSGILPDNFIKEYGSARAFKTDKRRLLREIRKLADQFFVGSVCIPDEAKEPQREFRTALSQLEDACSERKWGR